jgi:hypothetical protein
MAAGAALMVDPPLRPSDSAYFFDLGRPKVSVGIMSNVNVDSATLTRGSGNASAADGADTSGAAHIEDVGGRPIRQLHRE